jgi:hypothetical protein
MQEKNKIQAILVDKMSHCVWRGVRNPKNIMNSAESCFEISQVDWFEVKNNLRVLSVEQKIQHFKQWVLLAWLYHVGVAPKVEEIIPRKINHDL